MKKLLCILLVLCILPAGCAGMEAQPDARIDSEIITDNVENAEVAAAVPTLAQSEALTAVELKERLRGFTPDDMRNLWGEPDGSCSGMWCDIWLVGGNTYVYIYYDSDGIMEEVKKSPKYDWGISLTTKDVTASGLTIVCTQSGGEPTGELQTGSWYTVQRLGDGEWKKVEYTEIDEEQVGWTMEAWGIPKDGIVEWQVDWSWLYDELPAGQYRIGKEIVDFREAGDYDEAVIYAEFTIE